MTCDDFRRARSMRADTAETRAHLAECLECAAIDEAMTVVAGHLDDESVWVEPGPDVESAVMAAVGVDKQAGRRSSGAGWLFGAVAVAVVIIGFAFVAGSRHAADWEVQLAATQDAPGARAVALGWREEAGTRVVLNVSGLDPAPDGFVYELWFSNPDLRVSAGTFTGNGEVELWAGVSRRDYPRLWVTLQPAGAYDATVTVLDTLEG